MECPRPPSNGGWVVKKRDAKRCTTEILSRAGGRRVASPSVEPTPDYVTGHKFRYAVIRVDSDGLLVPETAAMRMEKPQRPVSSNTMKTRTQPGIVTTLIFRGAPGTSALVRNRRRGLQFVHHTDTGIGAIKPLMPDQPHQA